MVASTRSEAAPKRVSSEGLPSSKKRNRTPKTLAVAKTARTEASSDPAQDDNSLILSILHSLLSRLSSAQSTICPSQIARKMHELYPAQYSDWRALMDPVRDAVWEEVVQGRVEVTQGGVVRTPEEREGLKGPIRVRRGPGWEAP